MSDEERKRRLRSDARRARALRAAATDRPADWTETLSRLDSLTAARTVAAYTAYGDEPSIQPLLRMLLDRGARVLLPVLRTDRDLGWVAVDDDELPDELLRSDSPLLAGRDARRDLLGTADVVLVPALLVAEDGVRLGQGGGSYDRALTRVRPAAPVVAVVHDEELVPAGSVPRAAHDRLVTHAATPTRLVELR